MSIREAILYRVHTFVRFAREPRKFIPLLTTTAGLRALRYALFPPRHGSFSKDDDAGLAVRDYASYDDYLKHQRSKLGMVDLTDYDPTFRADLSERLARTGGWAGTSVLCLAARIGTEVRAFHDIGAFAVGIDLEPGRDNEWVLPGDFHNLVFPDASVDAVYCNSLDHALDLPKTLSEVRRVIKPTGRLLVDGQDGAEQFDDWAATSWESINALIEKIEAAGFTLQGRQRIIIPQPGEELLFTVTPSPVVDDRGLKADDDQ